MRITDGGTKIGREIGLFSRFSRRGSLLFRWVMRIIIPRYWLQLSGSMALLTAGTLAEAASFLVAVKILAHWASIQNDLPILTNAPLLISGASIVFLIICGAAFSYLGHKLAAIAVVKLDADSFVQAIEIIRNAKAAGIELSSIDQKELISTAPRFMGRVLLQVVGLGTSAILIIVGVAVCAMTFPLLSALLLSILLLMTPALGYLMVYSTNIGHSLRSTAASHGIIRKDLSRNAIRMQEFDSDETLHNLTSDSRYSDFMSAYKNRLLISPLNKLLSNLILASCIFTSVIWMTSELTINANEITRIVTYIVFIRILFSGIQSITHSIQVIASCVPYFLNFVNLDDRMSS